MAEEALTVLSLCRAATNHRETYSCDRDTEEGSIDAYGNSELHQCFFVLPLKLISFPKGAATPLPFRGILVDGGHELRFTLQPPVHLPDGGQA